MPGADKTNTDKTNVDELRAVEPSIIIAVDGSKPSMQAVDYSVHMTGLIPKLRFVLLYILPQIPPTYRSEAMTSGQMLSKVKKLEGANKKHGRHVLDLAKERLLAHGLPEGRIETRLQPRRTGLAKDIINEAELYRQDALVIGRRGLTRTQEIFMGSVSNQLVQHAANVPLWIVDGTVIEPKILVAVDGSPMSLRVVDYVAFMLGTNPEAEVNFIHVAPKLQSYCPINVDEHKEFWEERDEGLDSVAEYLQREDNACIGDFMSKAANILRRAGFSQNRISYTHKETTLGVAKAIVGAAKEGGFGTVAVGRRGFGRSPFLGSVGDRIVRRAEDLAVWLVN